MLAHKKILIIQTAYIGDVILATSLIEYIKAEYPNAQVDFLLRQGNQNILENNPLITNLWIWNKKVKYKSMIENLKNIRAEKYDYVFNIQRFTNAALFTLLSGAKKKVGFHSNILSWFFNKRVQHKIPYAIGSGYLHEVQRNFLLINEVLKCNIPPAEDLRPKIYFTDEDTQKVSEIKPQDEYIVLAPASVWFTKQYPKEKWAELVQSLKDYICLCIGAPSDFDFINDIIKDQDHALNLAGKLSLRQSALLMKDATRVFVNDSAPLHLASSVNAKTTAIFCSTVPEFGYGPLSSDSALIQLAPRLECMPCGLHGRKECPIERFKCGFDIETQKLVDSI